MFCANCGKTLKADNTTCPHCGAPVGENRFQGHPYTAAQPKIAPGETGKISGQFRPYTRTTYTSMGEPDDDVLSRTTYRPVLEEETAAEDVPAPAEDMPASDENADKEATPAEAGGVESLFGEPAAEAASEGETAPAEEKEEPVIDVNPDDYDIEPIVVEEHVEISPEIQRMLAEKDDAPVRNERVKRSFLTDKLPFGRKETPLFDEDDKAEAAEDMPTDAEDDSATPLFTREDDNSETFEADEEESYEFGVSRRRPNLDYGAIVKYAVIALVIIAVFVGGYLWIDYVIDQKNTSPIDGVSRSLYEEGIEYISTLTDDSFKMEMIALYQSDPIEFLNRADAKAADINAMMPETPQANDQLFVQAMLHIVENVGSALSVDGMNAAKLASATADERNQINVTSSNNWRIVQNGIDALKAATTPSGLTSIVNSQKVTVNTEPVEDIPLDEPTYDTSAYTALSKDMQSDAVRALQERLIELGWLVDTADGKFGPKTQVAVKFFQQEAGFDVDGIASPELQALLFSDDAPRKSADPTASPAA